MRAGDRDRTGVASLEGSLTSGLIMALTCIDTAFAAFSEPPWDLRGRAARAVLPALQEVPRRVSQTHT